MNNCIKPFLDDILMNVAAVLNLEDWKHCQLKFDQIGQNYFGILVPLVLCGKSNGTSETFRLVMKMAPTDERYRVSGAVTSMFAREIFSYTKLIYQYQVSQQMLSLDPYLVPSCYYARPDYCREVVVLQDMTAEGFKPYTQTMFLDLNHTAISLKSLAIFHAHSFILRQRDKKAYQEATEVCVSLSVKSNKRYMDVLEDRLARAIQTFKNTFYVSLIEDIKRKCVQLVEAASDSVKDTCICHGDIWKENILFRYNEGCGGGPVSACLIDYQTTRVSSPAYDVLYLVTSSTDAVLRREHFRNLIDTYYEQFDRVLTQAGFVSQDVYSRETLESDLKTVAPACFIVANTALWLASGCQQEGHIRSKKILNTKEERSFAVERYKIIIKDIIDDFTNYEYLDI